MKKAQVSLEYLIIFGFIAAITVPMIIIFNTHSSEINQEIISNQASYIASKVVDSAETVYYLGESSKITLRVYMPKEIDSITINNQEVVFYIRTLNGLNEVVHYSPVAINGSLTPTSGIHNIVIESKGDYVWVSN